MTTRFAGSLVGLALLTATPFAAGKGITFTIQTRPDSPHVGELVRITVHGASETPGEPTPACPGMRVLAIAPSVRVRDALPVVEGGRVSRSVGRWDAFRLASLRRVDDTTWGARLRPNAAGRWTFVIPNWCADGYVLPEGALQRHVVVRRAGRFVSPLIGM